MEIMSIYNHLPISLQNAACYYEGAKIRKARYSRSFWDKLEQYENRNLWDYEKLIEYQNIRLQEIVKHCYLTVPYYRNLFDTLKLNYRDIKSKEDLAKLPILTKRDVNKNPKAFLCTAIPLNRMIRSHTSGTTGSGFVFYTTSDAMNEQWAVWWRYRRNLGINYGTWCAQFGSKLIVPVEQHRPPFWRTNAPNKQIYFSGFHENENNLYEYYKEINRRKIGWIHGFPSLITPLASFMVKNGLHFDHVINFVTIGAENLLYQQENIMREAFGAQPKQHYGLAEGVANFSQNRDGMLYVDEDFAAVEFLDSDLGSEKRIIGTNLTNYAMPLLRWDTGDMATLDDSQIGRRYIKKIDGRSEDYILLPDGRKIGKLDHVFKDTVSFAEVQLYQKDNYDIIVYAVQSSCYCSRDKQIATSLLRQSLGNELKIEFCFVDKLIKTKGGKTRFVISDAASKK